MLLELANLLFFKGVPENTVDDIVNQLSQKKQTSHATSKLPVREQYEQQLRADVYALRLLIKIFYYDFVLFGFDFPTIKEF